MARVSQHLIDSTFPGWVHPYKTFEAEVESHLAPGKTLLDVGCGRTAPVLKKYEGRGLTLIGIDMVEFTEPVAGIELVQCDMSETRLPASSVDVVMARSVMEHVTDPTAAYGEMHRILRPGGVFIFLTANAWDYASVVARLVPNALHGRIVNYAEGRAEEDVFPTAYKSNTRSDIRKHAAATGLTIQKLEFLGQYPNYFLFNETLFRLASGYEKLIARYQALHGLRGWIHAVLRKD
jgi:SAM-dependent methyltransferase